MKCSNKEQVKGNFAYLREKRFDMMMWCQACWFGRSIKTMLTRCMTHCLPWARNLAVQLISLGRNRPQFSLQILW